MRDEATVPAEAPPAPRNPLRTAAKWIGIAVLALLLLAAAFLAWLNTDAGRRFVVRQINGLEMASGLKVGIGRIDGSLFGTMTIHDLTLADPDGTFFRAPVAVADYRPFAYLGGHIDVRALVVPRARLARLPALRPGDPDAPMLPDIDVDIGRLRVGTLAIDPAVTGRRHVLTLDGRAHIADGRAQLAMTGGTLAAPGATGGDRLALQLDAVPNANRLAIALDAHGPAEGLIAGLTGLSQPVDARIAGRGDWANWRGRARATIGGEAAANLSLAARDGTFFARGPLRPGLILTGPTQRLVGPVVQLRASAALADRRADLNLRLQSQAFTAAAQGLVDLGQNRFENVRVAAGLTRPGAIAPNLSGNGVRIALVLDGPFATPQVAYDLRAARLTMDSATVQDLRATGSARVNSDEIVVPISARARRITGFDAAAGGPLANIAIDGQLAIAGTRILSDNIRLRADRIDATVVLAFDLAAGRYLAAVQGQVNHYLVQGIGLFDIQTSMDLTSGAGGFGLNGRIAGRSRRIDNETVRDLLGGPALITANVALEPSGLVRVNSLHVGAPALRINSGGGTYAPNGAIDFRLAGVSRAYGPVSVRVTGTAQAPNVQLAATRPGLGIGLRDLRATVRGTGQGWALLAQGQSDYGPFSADVVVLAARGPLTIAVNRLTFAGIDFRGRLQQSAAGPFVGTLAMAGQGLTGTVELGAEGGNQRVALTADANGARTPGDVPIIVQRGMIRATAILYPTGPAIEADVQVAGLSSGDLSLERARARINYRDGRGQAQVLAEGRRGVPFRVAGNIALAPDLIRAALQGQVNNVPFRLERPAEIRRAGSDWQLAPATLVLQQGRMRIAGRYGNGLTLQARLDSLDLSLLNAFSPGLGIGGQATGSIDFRQPSGGALPTAEARLDIANFTRTGLVGRSAPVNIAFAGRLGGAGARLAGVIRRGGAVIGRLQANMAPLPGGGSWTDRLAAAPLNGGIRYNGPAEVPMSFANMPGHHLTGPVGIAADFSGQLRNPQFVGVVRANSLTYTNDGYGTRITNLAIDGRFNASRLEIVRLSGRAGDGTLQGSGSIGLASAQGFPIDLRIQFQNARLARSDDLSGTATGNLAIVNGPQGASITGEVELGEARYQFVRQTSAEIPELSGVRRRGEPLPTPGRERTDGGVPSIWRLDVRVNADNRLFVSGMGLESEWEARLRVTGTTATPQIVGQVELVRGTLNLANRRFDLRSGRISFNGSRPPDPTLDIVAVADIEDVEVGITIGGEASNPQIAFTSTPTLPQDEVVSRILFGKSVTQISALQAVQLAASLNSLRGSGGGLNPLGRLRSATGIDRLRILGADETTGRGTALAAGMYLSNDIYVEIITDTRGFTATQIEISLSRALSLLSQFGSNSGNNVNLRYRRDY